MYLQEEIKRIEKLYVFDLIPKYLKKLRHAFTERKHAKNQYQIFDSNIQ